jgi:hypothetical protein
MKILALEDSTKTALLYYLYKCTLVEEVKNYPSPFSLSNQLNNTQI